MTHEQTLSQYEARAVADYLEEVYQFKIGKTSLWRMTPTQASDNLMKKFGLSVDPKKIREAARRSA